MNNNPIGVFDSGIGGLTVLKQIIKVLPNEKYIYYADTDNVPYGNKPRDEVKKYIFNATDFLISKGVKAIVVACNTATSIAIDELRKKYNIPIIGIEPAIKPAVENKNNKKVLVLATQSTITGTKVHELIKKLDAEDIVTLKAMPKLVEFAEKGEFVSEDVKKYIKKELKTYNLDDYYQVVLGCTHFPLFKDTLLDIFDNKINLIDGSAGVANNLKETLLKNDIKGENTLNIDYYYSGRTVEDDGNLERILNYVNF